MTINNFENYFWSRVDDAGGENACWPYMNKPDPNGYGQLGWKDFFEHYAHRAAYFFVNGPIPDGLVIDHECHNISTKCKGGPSCLHRRCCNPKHLVAKTAGENLAAAHKERKTAQFKTHCINNHLYDEVNTRWVKRPGYADSRQCRTCAREKTALRRSIEGRRSYENMGTLKRQGK